MAAVGIAGVVPKPSAVAGCALLVLGRELQLRLVEEPHLRRVAGGAYLRSAGPVGRFLPSGGRLGAAHEVTA